MTTQAIFAGLTVVELASVLAGPAVGLFFAELGARVIKIENPVTKGDVTRAWKAPTEDKQKSDSAYYHSVNAGKEVHFLNLKTEEDRQQAYHLIEQADVVIVNYRVGAAQKLGMDYEYLNQLNPRLIYAELTGFGANDRRPAFDVVLQAETGFLYLTGEPDRPPVRMPVALIDILAAHQLKEGILVALLQRAQTGKGRWFQHHCTPPRQPSPWARDARCSCGYNRVAIVRRNVGSSSAIFRSGFLCP